MMKCICRSFLWILAFAACCRLEALPGDIPQFIPSDNVQRFDSVLPHSQDPTACLLALDWNITFRKYFDYIGPIDGNMFVQQQMIDDGSGWSQLEYQNITERHLTYFVPDSHGRISQQHEYYFDPQNFESMRLRRIDFSYDSEGKITRETVFDANETFQYMKLYYYSNEGKLWQSVDPLQRVTEYCYEEDATIIKPYGSLFDARLLYNAEGFVVEEQFVYPDHVLSYSYSYNDEGHLIRVDTPKGGSIIIERDPYQREVNRIYPDGSSIEFVYDDFGRPVQETSIDSQGSVTAQYNREYRGFRVVRETDLNGVATDYTYDAGGREASRSVNGIVTTSTYDSLGRLNAETDSNGFHREFDHDFLDRVVAIRSFDVEGKLISEELFNYPIEPPKQFEEWVYSHDLKTEDEQDDLLAVPDELIWMQQSVHDQVNAYRVSKGLPPLQLDPFLTSLCQEHCLAMASGAVPPGHEGIEERAQQARDYYNGTTNFGENVALNMGFFDPPATAVEGWIESEGHERQMVGSFELTGIGVAVSGGTYFFTQIFVSPK